MSGNGNGKHRGTSHRFGVGTGHLAEGTTESGFADAQCDKRSWRRWRHSGGWQRGGGRRRLDCAQSDCSRDRERRDRYRRRTRRGGCPGLDHCAGGKISIATGGAIGGITIDLAPGSVLPTAGTLVPTLNAYGSPAGTVLPGGSITLTGGILAEPGAVVDVSGASG